MIVDLNISYISGRLSGEIIYCNLVDETNTILLSSLFRIIKVEGVNEGIRKTIEFTKTAEEDSITLGQKCHELYIYELITTMKQVVITFESIAPFCIADRNAEISEDRIHLRAEYLQYYPFLISSKYDKEKAENLQLLREYKFNPIVLIGFEEFDVVNENDGRTICSLEFMPYILIAYKKSSSYCCEKGLYKFYVYNKKELKSANKLIKKADDITNWYNNYIFHERKTGEHKTLISLSNKKMVMGYWRGDIILFDKIFYGHKTIGLFAHEFAHNWAYCTDNIESRTDRVLEEGCAEICTLFYLYHNSRIGYYLYLHTALKWEKKREIFMQEDNKSFYCHSRGIRLFYNIYIKYGEAKTIDLIKHFCYSDDRTINGFLQEIRNNENKEIYDYIKEQIVISTRIYQ